ncbi:SIMPL domain-containing protein [Solibacillus daqui]|uniref:SIMPL domain-containing protein n=1 Tax=Solibacillus daqui TaxID=2912187 RepID=UPI002366A9E8|nr:SIMPL domain-containing protein [Solibacillus daqui]
MYSPQYRFQPYPDSREMTVTGNGEIVARPDYVQIQIEVRTEGKDVSLAQQENALIMNRVIGSLLALNIPREAIQTTAYTISPNYDYIEGRQVFRGYEVQNAITVKITDISQAGTVIDTAIQNGANHVSAIQFKIENSDAYYKQALNLALVNAIAKAKSMAETMQIPLQLIPIEIVEESHNNIPVPYKVQMSNQDFITPIEQGTIPINASVRVKFRF